MRVQKSEGKNKHLDGLDLCKGKSCPHYLNFLMVQQGLLFSLHFFCTKTKLKSYLKAHMLTNFTGLIFKTHPESNLFLAFASYYLCPCPIPSLTDLFVSALLSSPVLRHQKCKFDHATLSPEELVGSYLPHSPILSNALPGSI